VIDLPYDRAVALLRAGELVAFPTETVYGLGADASNPEAVKKIFAAKQRPADHPLIVHLADAAQIADWALNVPEEAKVLANAFWPGPMTLILKKQAHVSDTVTGGQDTVGLRIPDHPVAHELLSAFGGGVAAPSANRFGRISPTTAHDVREELGDAVALVLEGDACDVGIESTIIDLSRDEIVILRPGMIGARAIGAVLGHMPRMRMANEKAPRVSGSLSAHYAPRTAMRYATREEIRNAPHDVAVLTRASEIPAGRYAMCIDAPFDPQGYARELYSSLRALDTSGAREILVETLPDEQGWEAIHDRLGRAVTGSGQPERTV
jgi:L-threonylcarbamoyladenylate synthase